MSAKGWVFHEIIGTSIINPRIIKPNHYYFSNKDGFLEIVPHDFIIFGTIQNAALLFAKDILERNSKILNYMNVIEVDVDINNKLTISLLEKGQGIIDPAIWLEFKLCVEKIYNNLLVFT